MPETIVLTAVETPNLDTTCYRGSAPLRELTIISQADVFDQIDNPEGLQRDLSVKHAREAYDYAAREPDPDRPRAFPEIILNVRDAKVVKVRRAKVDGLGLTAAELTFDLAKILNARTPKVSRVDGNHRLYFGAGDNDRAALDVMVPFQIHVGLRREHETGVFGAINGNQKGLNTSHLAIIDVRLTPEDVELERNPSRVYARRLAEDEASPFVGLVWEGGSKKGLRAAKIKPALSFVALEGATRRMLAKSSYLQETLTDTDATYDLIRRYWRAVRDVVPAGFAEPQSSMVLANIGVTALGLLGATVIDQALISQEIEQDQIAKRLGPALARVDWSREAVIGKGGISGASGNRAALTIADELRKGLPKLPKR